jgi:hypothetical protein
MTTPTFTRQPDSTHAVIYGTPAGELLVSYWPSQASAQAERLNVLRLQASEGMTQHARVEALDDVDSLHANDEPDYDPNYPVGYQMPCYQCATSTTVTRDAEGWPCVMRECVSLGPITNKADPTQTYRLACGHTGI